VTLRLTGGDTARDVWCVTCGVACRQVRDNLGAPGRGVLSASSYMPLWAGLLDSAGTSDGLAKKKAMVASLRGSGLLQVGWGTTGGEEEEDDDDFEEEEKEDKDEEEEEEEEDEDDDDDDDDGVVRRAV
jgi:hypothetical protein